MIEERVVLELSEVLRLMECREEDMKDWGSVVVYNWDGTRFIEARQVRELLQAGRNQPA